MNKPIPRVVMGLWQVSTGHTSSPKIQKSDFELFDCIDEYRQNNMQTLDFGDIYLGVEERVGRYIEYLRTRFSGEIADTMRLHTKYVPDVSKLKNHNAEDVRVIINRSLQRLKVDTLDLVQFHWWDYEVDGYVDALRELFEFKGKGLIDNVGVTNFDTQRMQQFIQAGLTPYSLQTQYSILDRRPERGVLALCKSNNIKVFCYGTLAGGFLSDKWLNKPKPEEPFENRSLVKYMLIIEEFGGWAKFQALLRLLRVVADRNNCNISTVATAFILAKPEVDSAIIGIRNNSHLADHIKLIQESISDNDFQLIEDFLSQTPIITGDVYDLERNDPVHSGIMHKSNNRT